MNHTGSLSLRVQKIVLVIPFTSGTSGSAILLKSGGTMGQHLETIAAVHCDFRENHATI